jgi:hypothetical protein
LIEETEVVIQDRQIRKDLPKYGETVEDEQQIKVYIDPRPPAGSTEKMKSRSPGKVSGGIIAKNRREVQGDSC